ncbi:MAG: glycosyltransferase [Chloroflexota bacterium]|nr:glycosyltransferase [Chloroflexota bacterium]MDE2857164.1 glycosyltransferase [Chloroflexota bacterium]
MLKRTAVCWISSARYSCPLDPANARKWELLAQLRDYDIRVIGFSASLRPLAFREQAVFYLLPQPPSSVLRYLTFFALAPALLLALIIRHDCRVLVAQSPFEGAIAALVKGFSPLFGKRPKLIIENHNNFEEDLFLQREIPFVSAYRALMLSLARYAFSRGDALRVISTSTSERASHYAPGLPQVRFMTWSDTDVFRAAGRGLPLAEANDLVYAGVLIPRKGVDLLLESFARLDHPQAQLHLLGHPENADYAGALKKQAQHLGIASRVHFHGAVSQRDLAEYFGSARALVLPSLSEGLGRVVVEAMLTGTPAIGSRVGGIPDLIQDGENGFLVESGNVDALTCALEKIYAADVERLGRGARDFARQFFSPEKYLDGYRRLFELVMDSDRASP